MKTIISRTVPFVFLASTLLLTLSIPWIFSIEVPETEWTMTYGKATDDDAYDVIQTSDGGYTIAGRTRSPSGDFDAWFVKTDEYGIEEWNRTFGGSADDFGFAIIQTCDGGYAMACHSWSFGPGGNDFWLIKTDSNGYLQWDETYGYSGSHESVAARSGIVQTLDGGYALGGSSGSDLWLVRTDSEGNMLWNRTCGSGVGNAFAATNDGGYVIAGHSQMVKTDEYGTVQWSQTLSGWPAHFVSQTDDSGYAVAGGFNGWWLIKTDSEGNTIWKQTYGGSGDYLYGMDLTDDGGYVLCGITMSGDHGGEDVWLVKTDENGVEQWNATYGGVNNDRGESLVQTSDKGYALAARTWSFGAGGADAWLVKIGSEMMSASVNIDPDTLNLKSNGEWITAYITLPEGHLIAEIDIATLKLKYNDWALLADWAEIQDGVLMVKFNRIALRDHLGEIDFSESPKFYDISLTVSGKLMNGASFEGSDTIAVLTK